MKNCIIIIPVYLDTPNAEELRSFRQTLSVLRNHDITVVTHENCNLGKYRDIARETGKIFSVELFDESFFKSVASYNSLCYNVDFYERFSAYEYMLICQLDVWVFDDQLTEWCLKGYDYVGAPIFHAYNPQRFTTKFLGIGNGGFSLRRIQHCLRVLKSNRKKTFVKPVEIIRFYWNLGRYTEDFTNNPLRILGIIPTVIMKFVGIHNTLDFYISNHINEDLIFGHWSNCAWGHSSRLPDMKTAAAFAFDANPEYLYKTIGGKLPFACHAYTKWGYQSFWSKYIRN